MERKKTKKLNIKDHKRFKMTINFQISMIYAFIASSIPNHCPGVSERTAEKEI